MSDKITMRKSKDKTVVDAKTQTMRCTACGDEVPIPLGVIAWVTDVMQAFSKVHRGCTHEPGRTRFSVPNAANEPRSDSK